MILIYSENENAHVGLPPGNINGAYRHYRDYRAEGHTLVVDGDDAELVSHDASLIVELPGFRLASAKEQEKFSSAQQTQSGAIVEKQAASTDTQQSQGGAIVEGQDPSTDPQQPQVSAPKGTKGGKGSKSSGAASA